MMLASSQSIQTSNPLDTSASRRVNSFARPSSSSDQDEKQQQQVKQEEDRVLRELRARDREVRAHEAAHMAAGAGLVRGGASYTYQRGPDGRSYAIGGEVRLDTSPVRGDPEATLEKASQIRAAALAPANPSPQDLRVAASANQLASRARVDLALQKRQEAQQEQQERLEQRRSESADSTRPDQPGNPSTGSATVPPQGQANAASAATEQSATSSVPAPSASINTALASNEPPAAAISAFMATAESEPQPASINQFV